GTGHGAATRNHGDGSGAGVGGGVRSESAEQMEAWRETASVPVMTTLPVGVSEWQPFQVHAWPSLGTVAIRLPIGAPDLSKKSTAASSKRLLFSKYPPNWETGWENVQRAMPSCPTIHGSERGTTRSPSRDDDRSTF